MRDRGDEGSTTATVLFTDLVGSTDIRQALGDDDADELRRRHDDTIRAAAAEHLGEVVKGTGDGLMIVFPAAAQGVAGATSIQRAIDRLNRSLPAPLGVRIGLSAGDVAWEGEDCFGSPVVEAARLCDAASAGQILSSEVVRLLAGSRGGHLLEPVGTLELKGLGDVEAYEVVWARETDALAPLPAALSANETLPLIGRLEEREALSTAWKRTVEGSPQVALVAGEPGVGKTRLAAELAHRVHAEEDGIVLFGRCDEELGVPYQPFAEATGTYASGCDDEVLSAQLGPSGADLVRLVPSLATRLALPEPMRADPETERYWLFDAFSRFLGSIAAERPVLLVVDDLHWAAKPTLLLLRHVVRHRSSERVMVVATYRDTDLGRGHPLSDVLADLRREPDVERVLLRGLSESEVVDLVATAAGHDLDDATTQFARDLHAETEGNPFFVGQVLRHLVETGGVRVENGRWVVSARRPVGIPEGVREVIGRRLAQLSAETNDVLSVAAVIGREFDSALLVEASALDTERVLDALEEAEASRLVVPLAGRDDRRTFAHALVRSTLCEEIATTRRLRIHRRVVHALEDRAARGVPCLDQLAHHSCEAAALGDVDSALRWSRAAAEDAFARLAYEEAASQYERALDVLDPDDPAQLAERAAMRVSLARALRAAGAIELSRSAAVVAAEEARGAERPEILVDAGLVIGGDRGWSEAGIVDDYLLEVLEEGLARLPPGDSRLRAMAMARLASELYFVLAESDRREQLTAEALAMVERLGDPEATGFVLNCALWGGWVPDNAAERRERALEVIELGRRSGNVVHELTGVMWLITCEAELGNGDDFRAALARQREMADRLRQPEWLWVAGVHQTAWALMEARYDDAKTLIDETLQIGSQLGSETVLQMYGIQLFAVARAQGGLEPLVPTFEAMVEQYPLLPAWRCGLAYLYRELGMVEEARQQFEHLAADDFESIPLDANWKVGIATLSAVCAMIDDAERAGPLYDMLLPLADTFIIVGMPADILGSAHAPLMLLAATRGRWEQAEAHYEAALAGNQRMGCRSWHLYTRFEWGRLLAGKAPDGERARARPVLEACAAEAREVGMTRVAEMSTDLLAGLS